MLVCGNAQRHRGTRSGAFDGVSFVNGSALFRGTSSWREDTAGARPFGSHAGLGAIASAARAMGGTRDPGGLNRGIDVGGNLGTLARDSIRVGRILPSRIIES